MKNHSDVDKLVEDLMLVKSAIIRSNNILKYIDVSRSLAVVGLWSGIVITILAGWVYLLVTRFGSFADAPAGYRIGLYLTITAFVALVGAVKLRMILTHARKLNRNITVDKLVGDIYTTQMLSILIPFVTAITVTVIFLATKDLALYIIPALSVLFGLLCISYLNIFYIKELMVVGDWLIATGLITLFAAQTMHPLLALIFTFGLGFSTLWVAHKLMDK